MWKLVVGFVLFAALSLFVIMKGGDSLDMSGEKHGADTHVEEKKPEAAAPAAPAPAAAPAAPVAEEKKP
jgi:hypothetical protein